MKQIVDDLDAFLAALPPQISQPLAHDAEIHDLLEVVMDLGRPPEARFPCREVVLSPQEVTEEDIKYVASRIGVFSGDNRAGIERTLHRISAVRNRQGKIVGLTLRVGRAVFGTIRIIADLIQTGKSLLLLGRPGVGKTTMLREVARVLADDFKKRVVIVDTSNEIAGDGDIPHPAIGHARRMQVPTPTLQHAVMIEAVENHMPEVIVIDEIGTELEAQAARTIAERGVQLVATAHGNTLENLILNPTLADLVGGIESVTLGDEEARRRGTQKSILERKAPPTFDIVVEIQERDRVAVHPNVGEAVDTILRGKRVSPEARYIDEKGEMRQERAPVSHAAPGPWPTGGREKPLHLLSYGVSRSRLEQAIRERRAPVNLEEDLERADLLVTSKAHYRRKPPVVKEAEEKGLPIYVLKSNTAYQMRQFLSAISAAEVSPVERALREAEEAAQKVLGGEREMELSPQSSYIRRLQHQLAERYGLASASSGQEPLRRVHIFQGRA
jgi:stage III sporulation protein SpoIIIAA